MRCVTDDAILRRFLDKDRIYDFLAGLNIEFDAVRVQILGKEDLPSLNETIAIVRAEEGRQSVMLETHGGEGSAMVTKGTDLKESSPYQPIVQATATSRSARDSLFCTYCKKHRHTREQSGNSMADLTEMQITEAKHTLRAVSQTTREIYRVWLQISTIRRLKN